MFQSGMNPVIQSLSGKRFKIGGGGLFVVLFCSSAVAEKTVSYSRDIRPILANNCFACQGPDKRTRKAKLRLDNREDAHSESIVPGNLEESELYYRITTEDEDDLMPSHEPTKSLTQAEKDLIKQWILEGADCEIHWAYKAPIQAELPEVENRARANNPIDFFVINRLEQEGLTPAREAKRNSLIRRVSFDLTGLPPSQEEVESFVSDHSSDAYEKLVDRLTALYVLPSQAVAACHCTPAMPQSTAAPASKIAAKKSRYGGLLTEGSLTVLWKFEPPFLI